MSEPALPLLGFQISSADGANIQGHDAPGLPPLATEYPSFAIFAPELASTVAVQIGPGYLLQPIFKGDVEDPLMVTAI